MFRDGRSVAECDFLLPENHFPCQANKVCSIYSRCSSLIGLVQSPVGLWLGPRITRPCSFDLFISRSVSQMSHHFTKYQFCFD